MKRILWLILPLLLVACTRNTGTPAAVIFERGHGSVWGNQFYIVVTAERIVCARYIPEGSSELVQVEAVAIEQAQWQQILELLALQPLQKKRLLSGGNKLDGGEFRTLTLVDETGKQISYNWPQTETAGQLEQLLTGLVMNIKKTT